MNLVLKAGAVAAVAGIAMINTSWFDNKDIPKATLPYLSNIELKTLDGSNKALLASNVWKKNGAVIMVVRRPRCLLCIEEASKLSSLKNELDKKSVPLIGVVHQTIGVEEFRPYFKGDLFLDSERKFYGPVERWENVLVGLLRVKVWRNVYRAWKGGYPGKLGGEGRLMGGLFVVGSEDQGVLFEYRENEWGDLADLKDVMKAVEKININQDSN